MSGAVKRAFDELIDKAKPRLSAIKRILNPSLDGAGQRIFPARNSKTDKQIGVRIDKGEPVRGQENVLRLKLQVNKDAEDKTLKEMAAKDSHKVYATVDIDVTQEPTVENLENFRKAMSEKISV